MSMQEKELSYIAGFLDGDGCIMVQFVRRKDYVYGFQIRTSIVFYQKESNQRILFWLKKKLKSGYIRRRNDGMVEYTIVGWEPVKKVLVQLQPYVILKKKQVKLCLEVINFLLIEKDFKKVIRKIGRRIDQIAELNYSKKRQNTSQVVLKFLASIKIP